jgi:hypothetical protein
MITNKKFIIAVDMLLIKGMINSRLDLSQKINIDLALLNAILDNKALINLDIITNFISNFNIDANFLFNENSKSLFTIEIVPTNSDATSIRDRYMIKYLENELLYFQTINALLKKQVELKDMLLQETIHIDTEGNAIDEPQVVLA